MDCKAVEMQPEGRPEINNQRNSYECCLLSHSELPRYIKQCHRGLVLPPIERACGSVHANNTEGIGSSLTAAQMEL
jgi:hypothetical protein